MKRLKEIHVLNKILVLSLVFLVVLCGTYYLGKKIRNRNSSTRVFTAESSSVVPVPEEAPKERAGSDIVITDSKRDGYKHLTNIKYEYTIEFPENYDTGSKPLKEPELGESSLITFHGPRLGYSYPGDHIRTYARKIDRPLNQATLDALMKDMTSLLGGVYETYTTFCDPQENRQILIKSSPTLVYETYFKQFVSGTKESVKEVGPLYLVLSGNENSKETRAFIILGGTSEVAKEMALSVTLE